MSVDFNRIQPITTGIPTPYTQPTQPSQPTKLSEQGGQSTPSFAEILQSQLNERTGLTFSKHAATRISTRGVDVNEQLERLEEGVQTANAKGLNDALILIDNTAYIVSVKNNTVVTAVSGANLRGNIFTNIDGTVIA